MSIAHRQVPSDPVDDEVVDAGPFAAASRPLAPITPMPGLPRGAASSRPGSRRYRLLTRADLVALPQPEPLIDGVLFANTSTALYGQSGVFKSFVALAMACCVATGTPWAGRAVVAGPVVYLAGEGRGGLKARIGAWEQAHDRTVDQLAFGVDPLSLLADRQVDEFIEVVCEAMGAPALIVIDTVARAFGGGDENSAAEMGRFVAAVDRMRTAFDCTVLLVHHSPYGADKLRGSSALPAALDTIIAVRRDKGAMTITLACEKQKDAPEFGDLHFAAEAIAVGAESSLVLRPIAAASLTPTVGSGSDPEPELAENANDRHMLTALATFGERGARSGEWQQRCQEAHSMAKRTFQYRLQRLLEAGRIERYDADDGPRYRLARTAKPDSDTADQAIDAAWEMIETADDDDCDWEDTAAFADEEAAFD